MLSAAMEDYLKAIYELQVVGEGDEERVSTSALAEHVGVTAPTVTSMIAKLADRDLVDRQKYRGVRLTPKGERIALEVIRHHRLLETFLAEELDYGWDEVHEEADRLEHHISESFEARVAAALKHPENDPHGAPIPGADLEPPAWESGEALTAFGPGDTVVVNEVDDSDPTVLAYLADRGIEPGTGLRIEEVAPFGQVTVVPEPGVAGEAGAALDPVALPEDIAEEIRVAEAGNERSAAV